MPVDTVVVQAAVHAMIAQGPYAERLACVADGHLVRSGGRIHFSSDAVRAHLAQQGIVCTPIETIAALRAIGARVMWHAETTKDARLTWSVPLAEGLFENTDAAPGATRVERFALGAWPVKLSDMGILPTQYVDDAVRAALADYYAHFVTGASGIDACVCGAAFDKMAFLKMEATPGSITVGVMLCGGSAENNYAPQGYCPCCLHALRWHHVAVLVGMRRITLPTRALCLAPMKTVAPEPAQESLDALLQQGPAQGQRWAWLFDVARCLRLVSPDNWRDRVQQYAEAYVTPPLPEKEITRLISDVARYPDART